MNLLFMKNNITSPMINLINGQCQADFANVTTTGASAKNKANQSYVAAIMTQRQTGIRPNATKNFFAAILVTSIDAFQYQNVGI